jgi:hypothetical protein
LTTHPSIDLTAAEAADLIKVELDRAQAALDAHDLEPAFDGYIRALGVALQLGPAPTEQVLVAILQATHELALDQDADALSTLGPALVGLATQVRQAGALPRTSVMEAWATVTEGLGALTGQLGLAMALPRDRRTSMMSHARTHATRLDDATAGLFGLVDWLDEYAQALQSPEGRDAQEHKGSL